MVTFSVAWNVSIPFLADSTNGSLFVSTGALDFENTSSYAFPIIVRDRAGAVALAPVVVSVLDINEPPVFPATVYNSNLTVQKAARVGTVVTQLNARDPEGTQVCCVVC